MYKIYKSSIHNEKKRYHRNEINISELFHDTRGEKPTIDINNKKRTNLRLGQRKPR